MIFIYLKKYISIQHNNYTKFINLCKKIQINNFMPMEIVINYQLSENCVVNQKLNNILIRCSLIKFTYKYQKEIMLKNC